MLASGKEEQAGAQDLDRHGPVIVPQSAKPSTPRAYHRRVIRRTLRIALRLAVLGVLGYAVATRLRRDQDETSVPAPSWPPLQAAPPPPAAAAAEPVATEATEAWVSPASDGTCPTTHPIKAKQSSKIFHLPGMFAYDRTNPDRCYAAEDAAVADGLTKAKR